MIQDQINQSKRIIADMQSAISRGNRMINRAMLRYELETLVWLVQTQRAQK